MLLCPRVDGTTEEIDAIGILRPMAVVKVVLVVENIGFGFRIWMRKNSIIGSSEKGEIKSVTV